MTPSSSPVYSPSRCSKVCYYIFQSIFSLHSFYIQSIFKLHSVYIQCEGFATLTFCNSTLLQGFGVIGANPDGGPSEVDKGGTACLLFLFCCMLACVVKFVASSVGLNNQVMVARHAVLDSQSMVQTCYHRVFKKGMHSGGEMAEMAEMAETGEGGGGQGGGGGGGGGGGEGGVGLGGGGSADERGCSIGGGLAPDAVMPPSAGESDEDYNARLQHMEAMHVWADRILVSHRRRHPITLFGVEVTMTDIVLTMTNLRFLIRSVISKLAVAAPFFVQTHTHAARPADAAATCASRLRTSRSTRANQHTTFPARRPTTTPGRPRRQRVRCRPLTARGPRRGTDDVVQAPASAVGRAQTPGEYHPTHHQPCHPPTGTPHTHPTAQPHHSPAIPRHTRTRKEGAQNTGAHHPAGCS